MYDLGFARVNLDLPGTTPPMHYIQHALYILFLISNYYKVISIQERSKVVYATLYSFPWALNITDKVVDEHWKQR